MSSSLLSLRPRTLSSALPYAGLAALTALTLAACGPSGSASSGGASPAAGSTPAPSATGGAGGAGTGGSARQPGVSGLIAAMTGSTMQVQTRTDQTAVSWTDSTSFTKLTTAALGDVTAGSCVSVTEPQTSGTSTASPGTGPATAITAGVVQIRAADNGQCTGGFGGFGGGPGAPAPTGTQGAGAAPSGTPSGAPTGGPDGGGFGRRGANGLVTAVSGDTITVQETVRAQGNGTSSATSGAQQSVSVTTTSTTTYLAEKTAAASDVAVGECATALGKADDTGAVTATAISLRPATNGTCTFGAGGRGQGGAAAPTTTAGVANG